MVSAMAAKLRSGLAIARERQTVARFQLLAMRNEARSLQRRCGEARRASAAEIARWGEAKRGAIARSTLPKGIKTGGRIAQLEARFSELAATPGANSRLVQSATLADK